MLKNKILLVTGAARGIGREIALECARQGALVCINYLYSEEAAKSLAQEIAALGQDPLLMQGDVGDRESVKVMFAAIRERHGRLDVLVNNAGILRESPLLMVKEQDFDDQMKTNLKGSFNCMQYATKMMIKQKSGRIINISSIMGSRGYPFQSAYCATKAGIIGLTLSAAKELGQFGITVNAVAPGIIDTELIACLKPQAKEQLLCRVALGRIGSPIDVARVIVFLASDLGSYVTGQVIGVDGGWSP